MNTPSSVACCCIRTRSPSSAPPVNGDEGSMASTATRSPCPRYEATSAPVTVDLPTPGDPVSPSTRACPVSGAATFRPARSWGAPSSTSDRSRPRARASPSRARSMAVAGSRPPAWTGSATGPGSVTEEPSSATRGRGGYLEQQRAALAAAAAQRGRAQPAAAAAQLVHEVQGDPGARRPDRVAQGDGPAVHVDFLVPDAQVPHGLDGDRGERLVDLDQVQVGDAQPGLAEGAPDRGRGLGLQRR